MMVRKLLPSMLTAAAVVALPQWIAAAEWEQGPQRGIPPFFEWLDANDDGKVALDEIPDGVPDRLKEAGFAPGNARIRRRWRGEIPRAARIQPVNKGPHMGGHRRPAAALFGSVEMAEFRRRSPYYPCRLRPRSRDW